MLRWRPEDWSARARLGETLAALGQKDAGVEEMLQAAHGFEREGRRDRALEMRRQAAQLAPENPANLRALADALLESGNLTEAYSRLSQLASLYEKKQAIQEAIHCWQRMIECGVDDVESRRQLARLFETAGEMDAAVEQIELLADMLAECGDLESSDSQWRRALDLNPHALYARKRLAESLESQGRAEEALAQARSLADSAEQTGEIAEAIRFLEDWQRKPHASRDLRERLIRLCEASGDAERAFTHRLALGEFELRRDRYEEAKAVFDEAIAGSADPAEARAQVAELYNRYGLPELASTETSALLADLVERGLKEEAIERAKEGLDARPGDLALREELVGLLASMGSAGEAREQCERLADLAIEARNAAYAEAAIQRLIDWAPEDPEPRRRMIGLLRRSNRMSDLSVAYGELALMLERQGDLEGAAQAYRQLLEANPRNTHARVRFVELYGAAGHERELADDLIVLARQYEQAGAVIEAARTYERLIKAAPDRLDGRQAYCEFLASQRDRETLAAETLALASIHLDRQEPREAQAALERALRVFPGDRRLLESAVDIYTRLDMKEQAVEALRGLVAAYEEDDSSREAIDAYERILEIDEGNEPIRKKLMEALKKTGRIDRYRRHALALAERYGARNQFDLAERVYRELLHYDPENPEVWQQLIEAHLKIGEPEDLIPDYAILGDLLFRKGQLREACRAFKQVIEIDPEQLDMRRKYIDTYIQIGRERDMIGEYMQLADRLQARGAVEEALRIYQRVLLLDSEHAGARSRIEQRGALLRLAREAVADDATVVSGHDASDVAMIDLSAGADRPALEKALGVYQSMLRVNPENGIAHAKLAEILENLDRREEAMDEWRIASRIFTDRGEYQSAIDACNRVLKNAPNDQETRERMVKANLRLDSLRAIDSAISEIDNLLSLDEPE
ncbi:MAG: photosystem I assembly protein Ycf3 [candidate division BRC1 bacterium ADurb.BinA364]|nr:MAG: photosystem I assembly protein Ycf3 [candidate division BRC1 bacterium ADurb.BinA364]